MLRAPRDLESSPLPGKHAAALLSGPEESVGSCNPGESPALAWVVEGGSGSCRGIKVHSY